MNFSRFLLLLLPVLAFGAAEVAVPHCTMGSLGSGHYYIECEVLEGGEGGTNVIGFLSKEKCEALKETVYDVVTVAVDKVEHALATAWNLKEGGLGLLEGKAIDLYEYIETNQFNLGEYYRPLYDMADFILSRSYSLESEATTVIQDLESATNVLRQQSIRVELIPCPDNQQCEANNGSVSCPCQQELNNILTEVGYINGNTGSILEQNLKSYIRLGELSLSVTNLIDTVSNIVRRLESPDDRMFSEVSSLYTNTVQYLQGVATNSLNLQSLLYDLRQLISGDGNDKLSLSTEGVLLLNQLVFDMASLSVNQEGLNDFHKSVQYFSNTVSRLFGLFNFVSATATATVLPSDAKYKKIYDVFTNNTFDAKLRYRKLQGILDSGVTNWFQRMELYQQAQLGWFDTPLSESNFEDSQNSLTESGFLQSALETTNDLGRVNIGASNLVLRVGSSISPSVSEFRNLEINASLPTMITFFPEIHLGNQLTFGPIVWDTTEFYDIAQIIRNSTTLLWRFTFWGLYVALGYLLARFVFLLVLYVIHIVKDM